MKRDFHAGAIMLAMAAAMVAASPASDEPQTGELTPQHLLPLQSRQVDCTYTEGRLRGRPLVLTIREHEAGTWVIQEGDTIEVFVRQDHRGNLVVIREDVLHDGKRVTYDPPAILLPAKMSTRKPVKQRCRVEVTELSSGAPVAKGRCERQVELVGRLARNGSSDGQDVLVRIHQRLKLGLADASVEINTVYRGGVGPVQHRVEQTVTKLALFPETTIRAYRVNDALSVGDGRP